MTPLVPIVEPAGWMVSVYVNAFAGRSLSVAVLVTISVVSSLIARSDCGGNTGALFTSLTVTIKLFVAVSDLELIAGGFVSVTIVVMV